jgi:hypothetical protein
MLGAADVRVDIVLLSAPDSGLGADVKDDITASHGGVDSRSIGQVTPSTVDSEALEIRIPSTAE